ncbi:hypothetical protein PVAP13_7KG023472 [Panicum virgatum]|uniref:Uncharacterized protein n=1 Tax=Panicum virgatum TaxID=38727 RepID=A0A8T0QDT4_PANVG|nr:hypothetical protein PVAP13_7KG023472 [Panicum virgatum]
MVGRMSSGIGRSALGINGRPDGTALRSSLSPPWFHAWIRTSIAAAIPCIDLLPGHNIFKNRMDHNLPTISQKVCLDAEIQVLRLAGCLAFVCTGRVLLGDACSKGPVLVKIPLFISTLFM